VGTYEGDGGADGDLSQTGNADVERESGQEQMAGAGFLWGSFWTGASHVIATEGKLGRENWDSLIREILLHSERQQGKAAHTSVLQSAAISVGSGVGNGLPHHRRESR
jgi:hypothetical protein